MNRRYFLQCLGAFAASAFVPARGEKIARAPAWAKEVVLYRTSVPLAAGSYTFTAYAGDLGIYIGGVKATGGETLFEIPATDHPMERPRLSGGGYVDAPAPTVEKPTDFCDPITRDNLNRGDEVRRA